MSEILSFTAAFIAVQIFKIIMFKKDKDYSGYDERQELIRGRAFRYGFLTLAFSLAAVMLGGVRGCTADRVFTPHDGLPHGGMSGGHPL